MAPRGADDDLQVDFSRYEAIHDGLGKEIMLAIDIHLDQLKQFPEMAQMYLEPIRRLVMSRFP